MIKPMDVVIALMFADTLSTLFMVWLTSTNMLVTIITLIIIAGIFDAWTNGYCKLRKTAIL
jgi:hypothetical protein